MELAPRLHTPWLGLYGDLDQGIPTTTWSAARGGHQPVATEIVRYADAQHGFNCDDRAAVFNPTAAADGWARTLAWFDQHVRHEVDD